MDTPNLTTAEERSTVPVRPAAQQLVKELASYAGLQGMAQLNSHIAGEMRTENPDLDKLIRAIQDENWFIVSGLLEI